MRDDSLGEVQVGLEPCLHACFHAPAAAPAPPPPATL